MMTSEEVKAAIYRVGSVFGGTTDEVIEALCDGHVNGGILRGKLIDLLRQADPDTHMLVPRDADGTPIHIGDELCGYGRLDGGVYCMATNGAMVYVGEINDDEPAQWMDWCANQCHHYHKPTVEEMLKHVISYVVEYAHNHPDNEVVDAYIGEVASVYGEKLRELMQDE